jgi:hypothetical protein
MKNLNFRYLLVGIIAFVVLFCNITFAQKNYYLAIESKVGNERTFQMNLEKKTTTIVLSKKDSLGINVKCFEDAAFSKLSDLQPVTIELGKLSNGEYISLGTYPNNIVLATLDLGYLENDVLFITTDKFDGDSGKLKACLGIYLLPENFEAKKRGLK